MKEDQLQEGEGRSLFTLKNFLLLLAGFILGYIIKGQAVQNITMGYDDYKIITKEQALKEAQELPEKEVTNEQNTSEEKQERSN